MIGGDDGGAGLRWPRHIADMDSFTAHIKAPGEVEITIIQMPIPGNRNQGSAHQPFNRAGVEIGDQLLQVIFQIARLDQPLPETPERCIGKIKEAVECYPPFVSQNLVVSFFGLFLAGRQKGTGGIGYQVKLQPGSVPAVTNSIQLLQCVDALFKNSVPAL